MPVSIQESTHNQPVIYPAPIDTLELMPEIDALLLAFLENLSEADWHRPTLAGQWNVKDIAAHLWDGNLRSLSMLRDHYFGVTAPGLDTHQGLVSFLNQLNADWVIAAKRLSTKVLIELLKTSGQAYCAFLKTLPLAEAATFSVAWAGETSSKNWFHIAREYTEKWHHQQQIRWAVCEDQTLLQEKWIVPYLDTSVRALPHHYRNTPGSEGDLIKFVFEGSSRQQWYLRYEKGLWQLLVATDAPPNCEVQIRHEDAWRIFTKGMTRQEALARSVIIGKKELGSKVFDMLAVMA